MQCPLGGTRSAASKSILDVAALGSSSKRCRPYNSRMSGMLCNGIPIATCNWAAGKFTRVIISVTGCSTCKRGFNSKK